MDHIVWRKLLIDKKDGSCEYIRYFINLSQNRAFSKRGATKVQRAILRLHLREIHPSVKFECD